MTKLLKAMIVVLALALIAVPVLAGACSVAGKTEWRDADTRAEFDAGECAVCRVEIKAATRLLSFDADACVDGYCVSGIGTSKAAAWEDGPAHDISHVVWWADCPPTAVTLSEAEARGSTWLLWLGAAVLFGAVAFGYGWFARDDAGEGR